MRGIGCMSDASEASDVQQEVEPRRYRVRVCLQRFFSDERARCYVWVCAARRVRWLTRRLQRLFALPATLALMSRGYLLPPDEPLALLAPDDIVDVIPLTGDRPVDDSHAEPIDWSGGDELDTASAARTPHDAAHNGRAHSHESAAEPDSPCRLQEMKRRALCLLDDVAGAAPPEPPRSRRRRVRRRRAPRASPSPAHTDTSLVRRNCGALARPPRAVPAQCDAPPAPPAPPAHPAPAAR